MFRKPGSSWDTVGLAGWLEMVAGYMAVGVDLVLRGVEKARYLLDIRSYGVCRYV